MESKIDTAFRCVIYLLLLAVFPVIALIFILFSGRIIKNATPMPEDYDEPIEKVDERRKRNENNKLY